MEWFIKIPNAILQDKELSHTEMILYGYILVLSHNKDWCCFANNPTLWEYIWRDRFTVSKLLSNLVKNWHIKIEDDWHRKIYPMSKTTKGYVKNDIGVCQKWQPYNNNLLEDISKDISLGTQCKVVELVEAYKSDPQLPQMMKDVSLVQERAEYKQAKKNRAYKTIKWFIQQMKVNINTVRNNDMRADTDLRFRFAVNQSMENEWKWIFRNDKIEEQYQAWRKLYLLEQKQNE